VFFAAVNQIGERYLHVGQMVISTAGLFPSYYYMFLIGAALFFYADRVKNLVAGRFVLWFPMFYLASRLAFEFGLRVGTNNPNPILMILLALTVLSAAWTMPSLSMILRGNDISYGIYIYHMMVVNYLVQTRTGSPVIAIAITYIAAILSWKLVEQPTMRMKYSHNFGRSAIA
jgi:peptidoglycan/LPS O-acetylase OafA/YrhL